MQNAILYHNFAPLTIRARYLKTWDQAQYWPFLGQMLLFGTLNHGVYYTVAEQGINQWGKTLHMQCSLLSVKAVISHYIWRLHMHVVVETIRALETYQTTCYKWTSIKIFGISYHHIYMKNRFTLLWHEILFHIPTPEGLIDIIHCVCYAGNEQLLSPAYAK